MGASVSPWVVAEAARAAAEPTPALRVGGGAGDGAVAAAKAVEEGGRWGRRRRGWAKAEAKVSTELAAEEHGSPEMSAERLRVVMGPPRSNAASWCC